MNTDSLMAELADHRRRLLDNIRQVPAADLNHQYHPDLSPLGWHLGHCLFTEIYWIREVLLGDGGESRALKSLYVPELCPKPERAAALPEADVLYAWAERVGQEHDALLPDLLDAGRDDRLLQDAFLLPFLGEHYAQHYETTMYILAQRAAGGPAAAAPAPCGRPPAAAAVTVPAGRYEIGAPGGHRPYDNEFPAFEVALETFHIARRPVSNGEFLGFMEDGGYDRPRLWSGEGWQWRQRAGTGRPDHWRRDAGGRYYAVDETGPRPLAPDEPVFGINYYEACAFARWAGARLPHEYEWEAARKTGALAADGRVWEWCANPLHPYAGFEAFPYAGYSVPYFDGRHYVLRGGSDYTRPCIRRPSFRNYYEPDKRHVRAGLRLVWD